MYTKKIIDYTADENSKWSTFFFVYISKTEILLQLLL